MAARRKVALATLLAVVIGLMSVSLSPASATFAGRNGLILFNRGGDLYTATATGGTVKRLTTVGAIGGAKWSPDGKRIAYRRGTTVSVRNLATGRTVVVATGAASAPQWSPDGRRVAFVGSLPEKYCGEQGIFTVPSTGGAAPRLDYDPTVATGDSNCEKGTFHYGLGTYTPGGRILLTTCYGWYDDSCWISEVTMDGSSAAPREVFGIACSQEEAFPQDGSRAKCSFGLHLSDARVGPGGNGLLFSGKGGNPALPGSTNFPTSATLERTYAIGGSGTGLHRVSTAADGHSPTWSPTGDMVLFTRKVSGVNNVMKVSGSSATATARVLLRNASQADWQPIP
jgi:roadblock/LC7 domain-containing protein